MKHLFTPEGEAALEALIRRRPLLAFDFDGTLAPIVPRPQDARIPSRVAARLGELAQRLPLAIVTGRQVDDVRGRLGFEPTFLVGNHGAEDDKGTAALTPAMHAALQQARTRIAAHRPALLGAGVSVEDKGSSIALHYRLSRTRDRALEAIQTALTPRDDALRVFAGKMVVNIVARQAPDKAYAVKALLERCGASCLLFAGDDLNDEPVFAAATEDWLTIRVGDDHTRSLARYSLASADEVAELLERIAARLTAA